MTLSAAEEAVKDSELDFSKSRKLQYRTVSLLFFHLKIKELII
jgi:hypothetical protein